MEESFRREHGGVSFSRNESCLLLRSTADGKNHKSQFCNRLGCNGRLKSLKSSRTVGTHKEVVPNSSRNCLASACNSKRSLLSYPSKGYYQRSDGLSDSSSSQTKPHILGIVRPSQKFEEPRHVQFGGGRLSGDVTSANLGNCSIEASTRSQKSVGKRTRNQNCPAISSIPTTLKSSTTQGVGHISGTGKCNLNSLRCGSTSSLLASDSSTPQSKAKKKNDLALRRNAERKISSPLRKDTSSRPRTLKEKGTTTSCNSVANLKSQRPQNCSNGDTRTGSIRSGRPINAISRARSSNQKNVTDVSSSMSPLSCRHGKVGRTNLPISPQKFSVGSRSRPGCSSKNIAICSAEGPSTTPSMEHDGLQSYNAGGVTEVMLALERIEQDEEITYEQLLALETNFPFNVVSFHDQHRDMRLDIDNMTYEELLELEERMGTVNTALSEEELSKCLRRSIFRSVSLKTEVMDNEVDYDVNCSICQEEYLDGDDVGMLGCEHRYHASCALQWFRLKSWCPICKASAAPTPVPP